MNITGANGLNGNHGTGDAADRQLNSANLKYPDFPDFFTNNWNTINAYKHFARDHLPNNIQEFGLEEFLMKLEEIENHQSLYDPVGFSDDLLRIEKQHFELQNKLSFEPFVQSLRKRIVEYAESNEEFLSTSDKKVLHILHTAVLSKLYNIQNSSKHNSTVDLLKYLKVIQEEIKN